VINELKNIVITFIAAKLVITGSMTLGMMLAVQYILGQLNLPLNQLIDFLRTAQDAKLSLSRLTEVNLEQGEGEKKNTFVTELVEGEIQCMNLSFRYGPKSTPLTLKGITMELPKGKKTALVGVSGSGKTTLLKLLLKYYDTYSGSISVSNEDLKDLSPAFWRSICGAVLQNGFIFSDSILSNICESEKDTEINSAMFHKAIEVANLGKFIKGLPNGYNTIIGDSGIAISGGEKQRILIARAIYKDPMYMFFDEATSSLDAENERVIMERLMDFYENKTVLIIAHRLSTVKNADNILVLDDGQIVEQGTHLELIKKRGYYHSLVKNQLELGN
jgi:ATP-binding cassette subfamily B protein